MSAVTESSRKVKQRRPKSLGSLTAVENTTLGITSGVIAKLCNYPLLATKIRVQQGLPITFNPSVVYRGLFMACLNLGGTTGVQFFTTGFFQKMIGGGKKNLSKGQEIQAALLGGLVSGVPCCTWELIMTQQQNFGGTILGTPAKLVAEHGVSSLGRGMIMTCGRESVFTCAMLGVTPVLQRDLRDRYGMSNEMALGVGSLTGAFLSATVTHPMDTIKTRMQGDVSGGLNIRQMGHGLIKEFGYVGLFKGLEWRIGLIATTFFLVNKFKEVLIPPMFGDDEVDA